MIRTTPSVADATTEYGPCHLCGSETPERHGTILVLCECGSGAEICDHCHETHAPCPEPAEDPAPAPAVARYRVTLRHGTCRDVPTLREARALAAAERRDGWAAVARRLSDDTVV